MTAHFALLHLDIDPFVGPRVTVGALVFGDEVTLLRVPRVPRFGDRTDLFMRHVMERLDRAVDFYSRPLTRRAGRMTPLLTLGERRRLDPEIDPVPFVAKILDAALGFPVEVPHA